MPARKKNRKKEGQIEGAKKREKKRDGVGLPNVTLAERSTWLY